MSSYEKKTCATKSCNNIVLDGKYCEYCNRKIIERNKKLKLAAGGGVIMAVGVAAKKGHLKNGLTFLYDLIRQFRG